MTIFWGQHRLLMGVLMWVLINVLSWLVITWQSVAGNAICNLRAVTGASGTTGAIAPFRCEAMRCEARRSDVKQNFCQVTTKIFLRGANNSVEWSCVCVCVQGRHFGQSVCMWSLQRVQRVAASKLQRWQSPQSQNSTIQCASHSLACIMDDNCSCCWSCCGCCCCCFSCCCRLKFFLF